MRVKPPYQRQKLSPAGPEDANRGAELKPLPGVGSDLLGIFFTYFEVIPIVPSHVSTNRGHSVIGNFVRRSPNAWPPCAYKCISTGTPAPFSAM